jgi:hypothetical protein
MVQYEKNKLIEPQTERISARLDASSFAAEPTVCEDILEVETNCDDVGLILHACVGKLQILS